MLTSVLEWSSCLETNLLVKDGTIKQTVELLGQLLFIFLEILHIVGSWIWKLLQETTRHWAYPDPERKAVKQFAEDMEKYREK